MEHLLNYIKNENRNRNNCGLCKIKEQYSVRQVIYWGTWLEGTRHKMEDGTRLECGTKWRIRIR
jgi:hypothetical protein